MQAVGVYPSKKAVGILEHLRPEIQHDDVVKVRSLEVGICGTDREICTFVYGEPPEGSEYLILGHESLGEVGEVGSAVQNIKVGDLVVPSVRRPCDFETCQPCQAGFQDFCATGEFVERGIKARHGFMTEEYAEHEQFLYVAPQHLRDIAVLVEPLTIAEKALAHVWQMQLRLPWIKEGLGDVPKGTGLKAVVLGAGSIGILGAMKLVSEGFETYVYSRSKKPNPKAELVEAVGIKYISNLEYSVEEFAEMVGNIDLVYEAVGVSRVAYDVLRVLGDNGIFVFTGIPVPNPPIEIDADLIMRNVVLKNQLIVGTVNADSAAFEAALADLDVFLDRWPDAIRSVITGRFGIEDCHELLLGKAQGIKNVIQFS
ncbi:MAG: Sorbitol dehydrogenase [Verrucomicrobia subdivision 3 bacterium]|nr:Sorbitol dehydrogenase [Limisphaerales bacterium]MCS1415747.1 Sorbitol dehydrogenase [Limisphaerales bacterium]